MNNLNLHLLKLPIAKRRLEQKTPMSVIRLTALVLWAAGFLFQAKAQNLTISSNSFNRAFQVATTVRQLTSNAVTGQRDRVWLSFMVEFYKRNPDVNASSIANAYSNFTNQFNHLASTVNFPSSWSNPSDSEILNLALAAITNNVPGSGQYATYAISAVEVAIQLAQQNSPLFQSVLNDATSASALVLATTDLDLQKNISQISTQMMPEQWQGIVSSALALADNNPVFRDAYKSVITPLTGISPGDSVAQILQKIPALQNDVTVSNLVALLDEGGQLQTSVQNIMTLFTNQMNVIEGDINVGISVISGQVSQTIDEGLPEYLQSVLSPNFDTGIDFSEVISPDDIQSTAAAADLLSGLVGSFDPRLSQQISTIGHAASTVASAISTIATVADVGTDIETGDIAGAVMSVSGLFGGGDDGDAEQLDQIQSEIQQLGSAINNLHKDMDQRFDQVDQGLNSIYSTMETNFMYLSNQLNGVNVQLQENTAQLFQIQAGMNTFQAKLYSLDQATEFAGVKLAIHDALDYGPLPGFDQGFPFGGGFLSSESSLFSYATDPDATAAWIASCDGTVSGLANIYQNTSFTLDERLNAIDAFLTNTLQLSPLNPLPKNPILNPRIWSICANSYIQLSRMNPAFFQNPYVPLADAATIASRGQQLEGAISDITFANGGINANLWNAVINFYNTNLQAFALGVTNMQTAYLQGKGLTGVDLLDISNYLAVVAGNLNGGQFGLGASHDGPASANRLLYFGSLGLYPSANGGVVGLDYATNAGGLDIFTNVNVIRTVDPLGNASSVPVMVPFTPGYGYIPISINGSVIEPDGTLYFTYAYWPTPAAGFGSAAIAKRGPDGSISIFAGQPEVRGNVDGLTNQALFMEPGQMTSDPQQNLYVFDGGQSIREIDTQGNVSTLVSNVPALLDTFGITNTYSHVPQIVADGHGAVYILPAYGTSTNVFTPIIAVANNTEASV